MPGTPVPLPAVLTTCSCDAAPGTPHHPGCGHAHCPGCGGQLLTCGDCRPEAAQPSIWHGADPAEATAVHLGWTTTTTTGIDGPVPDYTRVLFAEGLGQITWDPATQLYLIGAVDEQALDQARTESGTRPDPGPAAETQLTAPAPGQVRAEPSRAQLTPAQYCDMFGADPGETAAILRQVAEDTGSLRAADAAGELAAAVLGPPARFCPVPVPSPLTRRYPGLPGGVCGMPVPPGAAACTAGHPAAQ